MDPHASSAQPRNSRTLRRIKLLHSAVWAVFVAFIIAIPLLAWRGNFRAVGWLSGAIYGEVLVLALNRWRCPLTPIAARFTEERRANFDIYLPEWLAEHNKEIFGTLFVLGQITALVLWLLRR